MNSSSRNSRRRLPRSPAVCSRAEGFTLMEVLIVIAILAFMSLGIYQATTETFRLREELSSEGDFYNSIRLSMSVLNRDISLLYSPLILLPDQDPSKTANPAGQNTNGNQPPPRFPSAQPTAGPDFTGLNSNLAADFQQTTNFWGPAVDKTGIRPSRFQGTETKMSFVSASHIRLYKDSPESEFAKITYELKRDENQPENFKLPDAYVLIKSENVDVFDTDDTRDKDFARNYRILFGITKLSFSYCKYDETKLKTCTKTWDSEATDPKHQYPDLIQVSLQVKGPTNLFFEGTYEFRPEVPLHGINPST